MNRIVNRRTLGLLVLGIWVTVLGMHVRREYFKPLAARLAEGARSLNPGQHFYAVRMNGKTIGLATTRLDTVPEGFIFTDRISIDVPAVGSMHRAIVQSRIELTPSLSLDRFTFSLDSEIGQFAVRGEVRGDSLLDLNMLAGGDAQKSTMKMTPGLLLDAAIPLRLAAAGELEAGKTFSTVVLDPSVLSTREVELRVTRQDTMIVADSARWVASENRWEVTVYDTIQVWRIEQTLGGIQVASWVDEDGHLVRAESPIGYTLERGVYEIIDREWKLSQQDGSLAEGYGTVIEQTAIASNVDLSAAGDLAELRFKLSGVELEGFDLAGGRQELHGDTLLVRRESGSQLNPTYTLPFRGTGEPAAELESTPLIQADDPEIITTARKITRGSTNPLEVAERINDWVYRELDKDITVSVPSARQVLAARQGDCNEHTVLFVALARAVGLPTRTAAGLVYLRGRFYYHAWPEVWLGNTWVAMDPTLGQFPADAAHLRFIVGGLARQVELIRLIGQLKLEVTA